MVELGCVKLIGKYNGKVTPENRYRVDPYAVTKLKAVKLEAERLKAEKLEARKAARRVKRVEVKPVVEMPAERSKKKETDSLGEMRVVEKAYIGDMGSPLLKQLDKLLAGVRAWKTRCQKSSLAVIAIVLTQQLKVIVIEHGSMSDVIAVALKAPMLMINQWQ
nr:hypothetical protein [Providencia sp. JUb39]